MTHRAKSFAVFAALSLLVFSTPTRSLADVDEDSSTVKARLRLELDLLRYIGRFVERRDMGQLSVLRAATQRVLDSVSEHGLSHKTTFQEFQNQIVAFRFSQSYLKSLETGRTAEALHRLDEINHSISESNGFDASPYTQITASVFSQMHKLVLQLLELPLPADLRTDLEHLLPSFGHTIAIAMGGDRPRTFEAAVPLCRRIEGLYERFNRIAGADAAFELVLEVQGLNSMYAEFAQVEREKETP